MKKVENNENEILIVEDTSASLKLLSDILTSEGYTVRPASDGELALRSMQAKLPSLVLLDIRMPGIDGYEVCRRLKADERTNDIPVIFLSSLADVVDKVRGFELGAVDYITKPYNREELLVRVKTHLDLYMLKNNLEALVDERTMELRESMDAYKELANKLSVVADYANDWEYWMGSDGHYIYVSPSCQKITGYSAEAFYADPNLMQRILHPDDKAWYSQHIYEAMYQKSCCVLKELRIVTKDGQTRYIEHNCTAIYKDDTIWLGRRGSNRDITERKLAQEKIRQSEEQFQRLFKAAPISLAISSQNGEIKYINDCFVSTFGYSHDEIRRVEDWFAVAYPEQEYRAQVLQLWAKAVQKAIDNNTNVEPVEYKVVCKSGEVKIVEISGISMGEDFLATFFDITKIKMAEESLKNSNESLQKMVKDELEKSREKDYLLIKQSRLAAMGEMISNIAHQWRQPLNALGITIQDAKMAWRVGEVNEEYINEMVASSMEQIKYMSRTIDDFRSFFKPDKERAPFSLLDVVRRSEHLFSASLSTLGVQFDIDVDDGVTVMGYENELAQVFLNLIKNAKDAIIENEVKDPKIKISVSNTSEELVITVKDNAGGINEAVIDRIFEPYFTTKEQGKGTGIGLYMSKIIVEENMGGRIGAHNDGNWAVFEIRFDESVVIKKGTSETL